MQPSHLATDRGYKIAYHTTQGEGTGVMFCCGYRSTMDSTKATALAEWCAEQNVPFTRFEYHAHGNSPVDFKEFTIGHAMKDALDIIDQVVSGPIIIVGSSMGAWVALNAALERQNVVRGLVGVASAPDFSERLMFPRITPEQRAEMQENGFILAHSEMTDSDYPITMNFITEARNHLLLDDTIGLDIPIHLFHGQADVDVPWETSMVLASQLMSEEVSVTLIKDGDHRLNRPADLQLTTDALARMLKTL